MAITDIQDYVKRNNSGLLGGQIVGGDATTEGKPLSPDPFGSAR